MSDTPAYGLWGVAILNALVFVIFAFSFTKPKTARDWRSFGAFTAFLVALFAEMYGFPLTIYLIAGWLQSRNPEFDIFSHDAGHLWSTIFGLDGNPHWGFLHMLSIFFIGAGFWLLASAWDVLYRAQRANFLATTGPYARVRHPQYIAFVAIMLGFLLQWPTLLTLLMFPVLVWMYRRLAVAEERELAVRFAEAYQDYARKTPPFMPQLFQPSIGHEN